MANKNRVNILGTSVSTYDLPQTVNEIKSAIKSNQKIRISVTPVNCILWARENASLRTIYNSADFTTADGVPLVWASRILGNPIQGRVTGLDLLPEFARVSAKENFSFFFLGAAEGVGEQLGNKLQKEYPGLRIAGVYSPPYRKKFNSKENREMIHRINKVQPDVLWVSLTAPKQDYWIFENFNKLNVKVAIGVGAAFDVVAGNIPRSPRWMQKAGLEWLYRFIKEPKRLFRRYIIEAPKFIPLVIFQGFQKRVLKKYDI